MKRIARLVAHPRARARGAAPCAWEAETTQAGLAEQAALRRACTSASSTLGFAGGLFEPLTIPPADAPTLIAALKLLSPTPWLRCPTRAAARPRSRGSPPAPRSPTFPGARRESLLRSGDAARAGSARARRARGPLRCVREAIGRAGCPSDGVPAPDWVTAKDNPFNLAAFLDQYAQGRHRARRRASARAHGRRARRRRRDAPRARRSRRSVARSRRRGRAPRAARRAVPTISARGSSAIAALAYGRLGVPAPSRIDHAPRTCATSSRRPTAAASPIMISRTYFSPNTLPASTPGRRATRSPQLARPQPALPTRLNLMAASRDDGTTLRDRRRHVPRALPGRARRARRSRLDDDCMLEQVAAILPEVAAYETGLLDFLLRGELTITVGRQIARQRQGPAAPARSRSSSRTTAACARRIGTVTRRRRQATQLAQRRCARRAARASSRCSAAPTPRASRSSRSARCRLATLALMAKRGEPTDDGGSIAILELLDAGPAGAPRRRAADRDLPVGLPAPLIELYARCDGAAHLPRHARDRAVARGHHADAGALAVRRRSRASDLRRRTAAGSGAPTNRSTTTSATARASIAGSPACSTRSRCSTTTTASTPTTSSTRRASSSRVIREQQLRAQLKRDAAAPGPRWRLAHALLEQGADRGRAQRARAGRRRRPGFAWAWLDLARVSERLGELGGAIDEARMAAEAAEGVQHPQAGYFWSQRRAPRRARARRRVARAEAATKASLLAPELSSARRSKRARERLEAGDAASAKGLVELLRAVVAARPRSASSCSPRRVLSPRTGAQLAEHGLVGRDAARLELGVEPRHRAARGEACRP